MESLSSEQKDLALDILYDIQSAIERLQERTERIHTVDDFLGSPDDFLGSPDGMILLDATCMLLIAIGESLKNLDKVTDNKYRHLIKEQFVLTSGDNVKFVVCNQWDKVNVLNLLRIAKEQGWSYEIVKEQSIWQA